MKRLLIIFGILMALALLTINLRFITPAHAYYEYKVKVYVNNIMVDFPDQKPFIDSQVGRTFVPLRFVSEALGAQVDWNNNSKTAIVKQNGTTVLMKIGSNQPTVNGQTKTIDAAAMLINDRTMVSLRFVSETLNAIVDWESATWSVKIRTANGNYTTRGYTIPAKTDLDIGLHPANDNPNKVDISILFTFTKTIDQQHQDAYNILASKFGDNLASEVLAYVKAKKDVFDVLSGKKWIVNNQLIMSGSNGGSPFIDITIWEPGKGIK